MFGDLAFEYCLIPFARICVYFILFASPRPWQIARSPHPIEDSERSAWKLHCVFLTAKSCSHFLLSPHQLMHLSAHQSYELH